MSRAPRIAGFSYVGRYRYFLTICTYKRQPLFTNNETVERTLLQFRNTAVIEAFELSAYCFMRDHFHLLTEAQEDHSDFRRFTKLAKQRSGAIHARHNVGPLWQEGYYEWVLRENDDSIDVARYLLNNPVRAGLVTTPLDYPYLGSDRWPIQELMEALQVSRP